MDAVEGGVDRSAGLSPISINYQELVTRPTPIKDSKMHQHVDEQSTNQGSAYREQPRIDISIAENANDDKRRESETALGVQADSDAILYPTRGQTQVDIISGLGPAQQKLMNELASFNKPMINYKNKHAS